MSGAAARPLLVTRIVEGPIPVERLAPIGVIAPGRGAVSSFLGVVRDHAKGRGVAGLYYECYRPMAERVLAKLAWETFERFGEIAAEVAHGTGAMRPGEVSVCIHVASAHRAAACDAARHLIERIKQELPVWKKQTFTDGESEWVAGS
jgi:molybdopterin synthase catalytic subunit